VEDIPEILRFPDELFQMCPTEEDREYSTDGQGATTKKQQQQNKKLTTPTASVQVFH
jgi:hypothetical protein